MKKLYFLLVAGLLLAGTASAQSIASLTGDSPAPGRLVTTPISPDSVFVAPDVLPQYPGGAAAMNAFLTKNIRYPEQAAKMHVKGRAFVRFLVSADGRISDVTVLKGPGNGLNEEALRLVYFMPRWEPGRHNGQPVRTACTLPISFE